MKERVTWKKLSKKHKRLVLGIIMMYSFLAIVSLLIVFLRIAVVAGVFFAVSNMFLWFFPPIALIWLTYFMLTEIYPPKENIKKKENYR